jgi:hypothetical protein
LARFEAPGRGQQQPGRVGASPLVERDLPTQVLDLRAAQLIGWAGLDRGQQFECRVEHIRLPLHPCGSELALGTPDGFRGEQCGVFEEGGGRLPGR